MRYSEQGIVCVEKNDKERSRSFPSENRKKKYKTRYYQREDKIKMNAEIENNIK